MGLLLGDHESSIFFISDGGVIWFLPVLIDIVTKLVKLQEEVL